VGQGLEIARRARGAWAVTVPDLGPRDHKCDVAGVVRERASDRARRTTERATRRLAGRVQANDRVDASWDELRVQDIPGREPVVAAGVEEVHGEDAERLGGGDEPGAGGDRTGPGGAQPPAGDRGLVVTLEDDRVECDRIDVELLGGCQGGVGVELPHLDAVEPEEPEDRGIACGDGVGQRQAFRECGGEAIDHRHRDRVDATASLESAGDARL
jgi:hypothetical protein